MSDSHHLPASPAQALKRFLAQLHGLPYYSTAIQVSTIKTIVLLLPKVLAHLLTTDLTHEQRRLLSRLSTQWYQWQMQVYSPKVEEDGDLLAIELLRGDMIQLLQALRQTLP